MIQDRSFADRFHNGKWQVSTAGGSWRHDGKGLFYLSLDKRITSAGIPMDASRLVVGNVAPLFQVNVAMSLGWFYDVSTDGKRFVVLNLGVSASTPRGLKEIASRLNKSS